MHPLRERIQYLADAAQDSRPVNGLTHRFYRYPARFSPTFARMAIECFSKPGDLVLDPYMGGGTTVVESLARDRRIVGCDLNSLAVFVTRVKTTALTTRERKALFAWSASTIPTLLYRRTDDIRNVICPIKTRNLTLPCARPIKKVLALAISSLDALPSGASRRFARCVLLNVGQWALNGRKRPTTLPEFRAKLQNVLSEMIDSIDGFTAACRGHQRPVLINDTASNLSQHAPFAEGERARLVVTSPPYPGIHMIYHRWQVDGRRETPAPYWIAGCNDGQGCAYYNFADRRKTSIGRYFEESLRTLIAIRSVMHTDSIIVQLVAFSDLIEHFPRYLETMRHAGFEECRSRTKADQRIWRQVPNRQWHATSKGVLSAAREILLVHRAV